MAQLEAIFAGGRPGLTGEAQFMEHWVHEIAGAVPSEGTPGAVGSMGAGSKAEDEQAGAGIAKAGNGTRPVDLVLIGAATGFADAAAVVAQARAAFAIDNGFADLLQNRGERLWVGTRHCIHDRRTFLSATRILGMQRKMMMLEKNVNRGVGWKIRD